MNILRNVAAVIVGLVFGSIANMALIKIGYQVIPPPAGLDVNDLNSFKEHGHLLEPTHFLFPFLAHAFGTLAGAVVAHLIAGTRRSLMSFIVGVVFLAGGVAACFMIPAPVWFIALDLLLAYIPMACLGACIGAKIRPVVPAAPASA